MVTVAATRAAFVRWRYERPFTGAACLLVSSVFLGLPAINNLQIGDLILTASTVSGVSTVVLSVLMALCGLAAMLVRHTRVVSGVCAMIIALVAFPAANFGGFIIGTVVGVVGAALVMSWQPMIIGGHDDESAAAVVAGDGTGSDGENADGETAVIEEVDDYAAVDDPDGTQAYAAETTVIDTDPVDTDLTGPDLAGPEVAGPEVAGSEVTGDERPTGQLPTVD